MFYLDLTPTAVAALMSLSVAFCRFLSPRRGPKRHPSAKREGTRHSTDFCRQFSDKLGGWGYTGVWLQTSGFKLTGWLARLTGSRLERRADDSRSRRRIWVTKILDPSNEYGEDEDLMKTLTERMRLSMGQIIIDCSWWQRVRAQSWILNRFLCQSIMILMPGLVPRLCNDRVQRSGNFGGPLLLLLQSFTKHEIWMNELVSFVVDLCQSHLFIVWNLRLWLLTTDLSYIDWSSKAPGLQHRGHLL